MAGFGRTGKWFAVDNWDVVPDIITIAKGINSGYVPLGAMIVSPAIAEWVRPRFFAGGLTYSGHPLACASAVASIEAFQEEGIVENAAAMGEVFRAELARLAEKHPSIGEVRGLGCFWGLELVKNRETREPLVPFNGSGEAAKPVAAHGEARARQGPLPDDALERRHGLPAADDHARGARRGDRDPRRRALGRRRVLRLTQPATEPVRASVERGRRSAPLPDAQTAPAWHTESGALSSREVVVSVTESPAQEPSRTHVDVTLEQFQRRLAAHGHGPNEIQRLWDELGEPESEAQAARELGLGPVIAVYLGLLLVVAASVSVLAIYWRELGAWGILALGVLFLAGSLAASEVLRRRLLPQPADVLEAVAVGWVGLVAYALERLLGVWPSGASEIGHIHIGLTTIAAAGLVAALVLMALRPDPLLIVPLALAVGVLAVDAAELVFGNDASGRQTAVFLLPVGLAWIALGLWLDVTRRRDYATWAHWAGLVTTSVAVMALVPKTVPGFAVIGVLGAISLFFSAFVRHGSFMVIGAAGVLIATQSALMRLGGVAPLLIAVVGLALVVVGLRWSRWREQIRTAVLTRMPAGARSFVTRLAP